MPLIGETNVGGHPDLAARDVLTKGLRHADEFGPGQPEHIAEVRVSRADYMRTARSPVVYAPPIVDAERLRLYVLEIGV